MTAANRTALVTGAARGIALLRSPPPGAGWPPGHHARCQPGRAGQRGRTGGRGLRARHAAGHLGRTGGARPAPAMRPVVENLAIVVNNAGISPSTRDASARWREMPLDEWRRVLEVNSPARSWSRRLACRSSPPAGAASS